jgi:hypothetical protein
MKTLVTLMLVALTVSAVVGCRASAEIEGDNAAAIGAPR